MPPASRITDSHACPLAEPGPRPHVGDAVAAGDASVLLAAQPAARVGDRAPCRGPADAIARGEPSVHIGGRPAARQGDGTTHGGAVTSGAPNVLIGHTAQGAALARAARDGTPFCELCAARR